MDRKQVLYLLILMDNIDYYLGKNVREIHLFRFCCGYQLWAMDGQGIFSPPQNPKGGNQKHTMNYWKKKTYFKF